MYKLLLSLAFACSHYFSPAQTFSLTSPDKKINVVCTPGSISSSVMSFVMNTGNTTVLKGTVGMNQEVSGELKYNNTIRYQKSTDWKPLFGERSVVPDRYVEGVSYFSDRLSPGDSVIVYCRLYNEGFAYRYEIVRKGKINLKNERSFFIVPSGSNAWSSRFAQSVITEAPVNQLKDTVERPLTIKTPTGKYLALGEAALTDYARMKFGGSLSDTLFCVLDGNVAATDRLRSPWRFAMIGNAPAQLLTSNYLVENLNEPCAITNTSWIKPGKILREVTLSTVGAFNCIDFAAKHNISYICFDAGWYGKEDSDTSDAKRVSLDPARARGSLALDSVIAYGKKNNVGVFLYVNRRALMRQLDTLLPLYKSWGVKGIKFGFVEVGSQKVTAWLHNAIEKAAKYELMADVHDEYRPTGVSRTFPNLLTQEGIRGDEESPLVDHSIKTIFTRMIAGAADNTNCYFTDRVDKMGSHVAQMAKTICIYSPLQFVFWYDRPAKDSLPIQRVGEITEIADLDWFDHLPTTWNESLVLDGDINNHVTIARRSGKNWFLGILNGTTNRNFQVDLRFLQKTSKYRAVIYIDNPDLKTYTRVERRIENVDADRTLLFEVAAGKGIAIRFEPM